ncbi:MAG TPA: hypothetical protein VKU90_15830 [Caulobacteraceae bacterium]|nr:hypothetical protein [Caulobacteraceae bacterium]
MDTKSLLADLRALPTDDRFLFELNRLVERWKAAGIRQEAVEPVLEFLEDDPDVDLGTPGPLVHFLDDCIGCGFEPALLASLARRPVAHTTWMLNRLLNVERDPARRLSYLAAMRAVAANRTAEEAVRERARDYLDWQRRRGST